MGTLSREAVFGRRTQPHMIVIAKGDRISHFRIRPWMAALCGAVLFAVTLGYLGATFYLVLRDDLINTAVLHQARMQHAYEDRISSLRAQVDRITSHRLLDQQFMENKIAELASRQSQLAERSGALTPLMERARVGGVGQTAPLPADLPVPALRPGTDLDQRAAVDTIIPQPPVGAQVTALAAQPRLQQTIDPITTGATSKVDRLPVARGTEGIATLKSVDDTLTEIEAVQIGQIVSMTRAAYQKHNRIVEAAKASGLPIALAPIESDAVGGPFIPYPDDVDGFSFEAGVNRLETALSALEKARATVTAFPIANPAPGQKITSGFGKRRDPILGRSAFHGGIDFRARTGTPIVATASGTVIRAGRAGGYGKMVEIRHANGITTRYAHLSRINVSKGQYVQAGQRVGLSGNTGRSTGPHLHYEVRVGGKPVNPMRYLKAGGLLGSYL